MAEELHKCDLMGYPTEQYGNAVTDCFEDAEGKLWVENGEYQTQVNYCPACGYKAKLQAKEEKPDYAALMAKKKKRVFEVIYKKFFDKKTDCFMFHTITPQTPGNPPAKI